MRLLQEAFITVLNMSITASLTAMGVMIARLPLKKAPRIFSYLLWAVVFFRLICPVSFSSGYSFLGLIQLNTAKSAAVIKYVPQDIGLLPITVADTSMASFDTAQSTPTPTAPAASSNPKQGWMTVLSIVWLGGIFTLLFYSLFFYKKIKRRLTTATIVKDNIYESDQIGMAFVLGFFWPKIYVPADIGDANLSCILTHEQTHILRRDYLIKPLAFFTLVLHWFNPLMWVAFTLMSRDMEMSCDESVLKKIGPDAKRGYSGSLLSLSVKPTGILTGNPLAFGESHVKARIKNVINYKKPASWIILIAIVAVCGTLLTFAANPKESFHLESMKAEAMLFASGETDLLKIGESAFEHYYSSFMGEDIPKKYRITKYRLSDISLVAGDEKEFCVRITAGFTTTGPYFLSANGSFFPNNPNDAENGGTCEGDQKEFRIKSLGNNQFQIVSIGTGGGGQGLIPANKADQKQFVEDNINIIMSSPLTSSNSQDYINAHQNEYNAILALDAQALPYLFGEFEKGGQTGLKGHIMVGLCRTILSGEDIKYAFRNPQDWYDTFKAYIQKNSRA